MPAYTTLVVDLDFVDDPNCSIRAYQELMGKPPRRMPLSFWRAHQYMDYPLWFRNLLVALAICLGKAHPEVFSRNIISLIVEFLVGETFQVQVAQQISWNSEICTNFP